MDSLAAADETEFPLARWTALLERHRHSAPRGIDPACSLSQIFEPLLGTAPLVIGQLGQSLDGRIATRTGHSHYINGAAALTHLHCLRALVDGVLVGAGTVIADDPLLTVRHVPGGQPARIVLDPNGRVPNSARLWNTPGRRIVLQRGTTARPAGVEILPLPGGPGDAIAPSALLALLRTVGIKRLLVEGGATTLSHFLAAGMLDRLHLLIGPLIIGSGLTGLTLPPIDHLDGAIRPVTRAYPLCGGDVIIDCAFPERPE
ncbi:RibD family protein [Elstera litoralis]|uniref:RibD family protein n=1 Tax=Elstera litoralis TaxID=552518 RepID=UPI000A04E7C7|nr:RibD family protein [Elstera litoralis]